MLTSSKLRLLIFFVCADDIDSIRFQAFFVCLGDPISPQVTFLYPFRGRVMQNCDVVFSVAAVSRQLSYLTDRVFVLNLKRLNEVLNTIYGAK